jgi:hypothetical protein
MLKVDLYPLGEMQLMNVKQQGVELLMMTKLEVILNQQTIKMM